MVSNLNLLESRRRILLTTPHLESPTPANPLTFKSNMSAKLKEGKVYFTPVQEGEGDPSPDNIRPISGWDGITVTKCGKNLFKPTTDLPGYTILSSNSAIQASPNYNLYVVPIKPNTDYVMKKDEQGYYPVFGLTNKYPQTGDVVDGYTALRYRNVFAFNSGNHVYALFSFGKDDLSKFNVQLELGSEATSYEPYTGTTITIPFPQTIYGGYVDLVNGEVVEEYYKFTLDGTTHYLSQAQALNANNMAMAYGVIGKNSGLLDLPVGYNNHNLYMVDSMPNYDNSGVTSDKEGVFCGSGAPYVRVILDPSKLSDISSSKAIRDSINGWLNDNPIGICYKLATPIHHTIDPQVIRPLKGVNNIHSDANGNIEIKFWTH